MKQFTSVKDAQNVNQLVEKALEIKSKPFSIQSLGKNKTIGLVFFNPSLRTRLSSQKAAFNLGANVWVLNAGADSWKLELSDGTVMQESQEHIKEAFAVMSQYCDVLCVRTFPTLSDKEHDYNEVLFNKILTYSRVPVVSLESATRHPLQSLADLITIEESRPKRKIKVVLSWAPHPKILPQCVANSFAEWAPEISDCEFLITNPEGYNLSPEFCGNVPIIHDQEKAFEEADFIYTKNWSSYSDYGKKPEVKKDWLISKELMQRTNNAQFMHCLPVRRNVVVSDSVMDSPASLVIEQANNRTFAAQTVFQEILKNI